MDRQVDRHIHRKPLVGPDAHLAAAFLDHPVAQPVDQPEALGNRDEHVGPHHAARGVLPAQQRLHALQPSQPGIDLGLIVQLQLAPLQRVAQVLLQAQLILQPLVHPRLEKRIGIAAGPLGGVHGRIGVLHQLQAVAMLRVQRHPHRTGKRHLVALNLQRLRQHLDHPVGQAGAIGHIRNILGQQHELVAANAGHRVAVPRGRAQPAGGFLQHLVTHRVAQHVVDRLEAVQVHEQHSHLARLAPCAAVVVTVVTLHRMQQPILEEHPIGQPGQRIDEGAPAQFLIGRFQLQVGLRERLSPPPEKEQQRHMGSKNDEQHQSRHHAGKMEIRQEFQDGAHPERGCLCGGAMPAPPHGSART